MTNKEYYIVYRNLGDYPEFIGNSDLYFEATKDKSKAMRFPSKDMAETFANMYSNSSIRWVIKKIVEENK